MAIDDVVSGSISTNEYGTAKAADRGAPSLRGVDLGTLEEIRTLLENWHVIKKVGNISELTIKFGYNGCYQVTLK